MYTPLATYDEFVLLRINRENAKFAAKDRNGESMKIKMTEWKWEMARIPWARLVSSNSRQADISNCTFEAKRRPGLRRTTRSWGELEGNCRRLECSLIGTVSCVPCAWDPKTGWSTNNRSRGYRQVRVTVWGTSLSFEDLKAFLINMEQNGECSKKRSVASYRIDRGIHSDKIELPSYCRCLTFCRCVVRCSNSLEVRLKHDQKI